MSWSAIADTHTRVNSRTKEHNCKDCHNLVMLIGGKYQCSKLSNTTFDTSVVSVVNDCRNWKAK